jgi:E3 Ubiquitin ligase
MPWVQLILAAVALLAAAGIWYWRSRVGAELALMAATETSNAKDIASKAPGTAVELKGPLRCQALLTSEFAEQPCVWYRALTEREYENVTTGSDGKRETRREFETVSDNVRFAPAVLEDATGTVPIDFEGAKVEAAQVHRRYESGGLAAVVGGLLSVGGTTLGHRYTEWIIAADTPVYILGTALAGGKVGKATEKKQPFVVSIKSEEERTKSLGWTRMWQLLGAIVCAAAALGFLYWAISAWSVSPT